MSRQAASERMSKHWWYLLNDAWATGNYARFEKLQMARIIRNSLYDDIEDER